MWKKMGRIEGREAAQLAVCIRSARFIILSEG